MERTSARKAGWAVVLLLVAWLVLVLIPRSPEEKPVRVLSPAPVDSKLKAVGLIDNVDWEGLPELFAVWADDLEWDEDTTQFAYWNPGSNSYSYFFEVVRKNGRMRFSQMTKAEAYRLKWLNADGTYLKFIKPPSPAEITEEELISDSPTHPFIFFRPVPVSHGVQSGDRIRRPIISKSKVTPMPITTEPVPTPNINNGLTPMRDEH